MPIVQAPAHDLDTLNTVVLRCKHVARKLGQYHVVITVDEALFCKLMELKWAKADYQDCLIVRLGGLHTAMKFLQVIGKYVQSSGLLEAWVEGSLLGQKTAEQVMVGTSYIKGIRVHKITLQALWRILLPQLVSFMDDNNPDMKDMVFNMKNGPTEELISLLASKEFESVMQAFITANTNPNFMFWWGYMQMVRILLLFTRAQRDGIWDLHLYAFQQMLPYFMYYNHINYARWGTIYLKEMHQLPQEVKQEFEAGNFVVKRSSLRFNQVDPDQSQEWLGCIGKKGGGIIGITRTNSALSRWALSFSLRSQLAYDTKIVFGLAGHDDHVHNETTKGRMKLDSRDEDALLSVLQSFGLFSDKLPQTLQNIANKDLATQDVEEDLLTAAQKGQDQLDAFVEERLLPTEERRVGFWDRLQQNKYLTFATIYEVKQSDVKSIKAKTIKADRNIFQRLITAYEAGRPVNLNNIMTHELFVVLLSLAETNGQLRSGSKAILANILTAGIPCPNSFEATDLKGEAMLVIDGQALVIAIGKPHAAKTFGDLSDIFVESVLQSGTHFPRIDVLFDRYYEHSIKSGTRKRRGKGLMPIRRPIESRDVPLPAKWENFIAHEENKADLANFLSQQLILRAPSKKTIITAGGFNNEEQVESSNTNIDINGLEAKHEEADTRAVLHCIKSKSTAIVVSSRDTDILVLLVANFHLMSCQQLWMKAGTARKRKYIPVHDIVAKLQMKSQVLQLLPAFHALTGSDSTSYIAGHTKKKCWDVFLQHNCLLKGLGADTVLTDHTVQAAEVFFCKVYGAMNAENIDKVRSSMFVKGMSIESLPPTRDSLYFHIQRSHYQALVWRQAHLQHPVLPPPETMGWKLEGTSLIPRLSSLPPIPVACEELITCTCTTGCKTARCSCKPNPCIASCKCRKSSDTCMNHIMLEEL